MIGSAISLEADQPKLLLHFDINKTLIAEDLTTNKPMKYILLSALAEKSIHQWSQEQEPMSYKEYVDTVLAPGDKALQREIVKNFLSFLEQSDYPHRTAVIETYQQMMEKMEGRYLIPSFVKLIKKLQTDKVDFRIILRTFGGDIRIGKVTEEIDKILDGSRISHWGHFRNGVLTIKNHEQMESTIEKVDEIYRFFRDTQGHIAIQDDWKMWNDDGERGRSGKPFIFDPEDGEVLSLFFDDNINPEPESEFNIVQPLTVDGRQVSVDSYLNKNIYVADVIQAILDDDFFVDLVNDSLFPKKEAKFSQFLPIAG